MKTAFKVRVEKSFLWNISRTIRDRGIVSMDEFCVFECEIWLTHQIFKNSIFPQKWFFNPNFERSFHPPNMKTGKNKKHVFLIFRSSITYPKIKMIGGGHLKYSPCQSSINITHNHKSKRLEISHSRSLRKRQKAAAFGSLVASRFEKISLSCEM